MNKKTDKFEKGLKRELLSLDKLDFNKIFGVEALLFGTRLYKSKEAMRVHVEKMIVNFISDAYKGIDVDCSESGKFLISWADKEAMIFEIIYAPFHSYGQGK